MAQHVLHRRRTPPLIARIHRLLPMYAIFKAPISGKPEIGGDVSPPLAGPFRSIGAAGHLT
jgi:hypothetical protein